MILNTLIKLRNALSGCLDNFYQKTKWQPDVSGWTLNTLRDFLINNYQWESDPVYGLLDHVQPIKHMNWQLRKYGVIKGDCDDLATYTIYLAMRIFGNKVAMRINLITRQHVIGLFDANDGGWHWCSNQDISDFVGDSKEIMNDYLGTPISGGKYVVESIWLDDLR